MICLTFDTDYMRNEDLERFLEEYPLPGRGTFFAHQYFPCLESTVHEICPHPWLQSLENWEDELKRATNIFPHRPEGIRIHSAVFSHVIAIVLKELGFKYSSNIDKLFQNNIKPYRHPWGIWELPIYYMDNMDFCISLNWQDIDHIPFNSNVINEAIYGEGLYVFDFHPLHIALNTSNHAKYLSVREKIIEHGYSPFDLRSNGRGVGEFFEELCSAIIKSGQQSYTCTEALQNFEHLPETDVKKDAKILL
jgi:hypothetical protein